MARGLVLAALVAFLALDPTMARVSDASAKLCDCEAGRAKLAGLGGLVERTPVMRATAVALSKRPTMWSSLHNSKLGAMVASFIERLPTEALSAFGTPSAQFLSRLSSVVPSAASAGSSPEGSVVLLQTEDHQCGQLTLLGTVAAIVIYVAAFSSAMHLLFENEQPLYSGDTSSRFFARIMACIAVLIHVIALPMAVGLGRQA